MSYEPHIYIDLKKLEDKRIQIENDAERFPDNKVYQFLVELFNEKKYTYIHFPQMSFVRCSPELTSFNAAVRDALYYEYDIDFKEEI